MASAREADVVVVGDSFAFGWGVEEAERFGNRLEALTGRRVFNLAVPTDLGGAARLLDWARGLGARPGRVVLAVCMENDVRLYRERSPDEEAPTRRSRLRAAVIRLWQRMALRSLVTTAVHSSPRLEKLAARAGLVRENVEGIGRDSCEPELLESSAARVRLIARAFPTIVLLVPSRGLWAGPTREEARCVHDRFLAALRQEGLDVVDPRLAFEATGNPLGLHFVKDPHWTPRGHDLAARLLAERPRLRPVVP
ncbi:MAG: hypothetical protein EDX89_03840 [Acidobacteria bacterium]|nr:MAG: hypothetical protein EDX89_03840 [Acidobacteriota bacterium]MCE7959773.1 hypothetical protein [Acidobacteria bacterium ACB2]